ncbi:MAG: alpha/beta hydrolase [Deltaproteobacteria bacterium]|nr:alpha/beta hydrolase [Deltaproteobacteria bacterium]
MSAYSIEREFIDAGELRFEVHTCGDPESERLVLCLHGFPEHAHSWRHQLPVLAELGYRVWAPNQRGYGETTPRRLDKDFYDLELLLADIAALIDAAGARSVTLVGHDWGGILAWIFALREIRPLERLVVMNLPHPQRFYENLTGSFEQRLRSFYEPIFRLPRLAEWILTRRSGQAFSNMFRQQAVNEQRFLEADVEVFREHAMRPGTMTAMLNWYRANPFLQTLRGEWPKLDVPTLMIWGLSDQALRKQMTYDTDRLVRDFTIRYLDACHWVQQDAPEETNAVLTAWLQGERGEGVPVFMPDPNA